ncbi:MAG: hypothetical protein A3B11_00520 [Candidatus Taylorbacteria bacterium RIFCSPLOWO2_01_FULL_44_26]|uniref:Uncharacterized protein n=2 Tax=Candidatus Tayloriibacteriota TaxID=1817919 RepID=A0A1G2MNP8_9BACT|nr:MAG: hypothetical protein A3D50_00430 [Candidatus Taylorbacteria bacterium RIFCSPHIGHO2_02_FULL_44_12]OHA31168.1 MAG: hypothetical protein A3B11_00520 [Candidatus Taylorbacteria bacterium RIFCSPLOWO2_01_FULL_44_26]
MTHSRLQTFIISVICLIAIASVALYTRQPRLSNQAIVNQPAVSSSSQAFLSLSTSTEWQKQFFDGNSTTTTIASTRPFANKTSATSDKNLTATDRLGRDFFTTYIQLRQAGLNEDSGAVQSASDKLITESVAALPGPSVYNLQDITIINTPSTEIVGAYGKSILTILATYLTTRNEAIIAMDAFDKEDMSLLKDIDPLIAGYKEARTILLSTPAPQALARYHVDILNGFNMALFSAEALRKADIDPLRGLAAVSLGADALQRIGLAMTNIQNYFVSAGIPFGY